MNHAEFLHPRKYAEAMRRLRASLETLEATDVAIGFPKDKTPAAPKDSDSPSTMAGVATIAAINEVERPFLKSGLKAGANTIRAAQYKAVENIFDGGNPIDAAAMVGEVAAAMVKRHIVSGSFKANAASTIKKKKSSKPLIDTGQMRASVTYTVRRRG